MAKLYILVEADFDGPVPAGFGKELGDLCARAVTDARENLDIQPEADTFQWADTYELDTPKELLDLTDKIYGTRVLLGDEDGDPTTYGSASDE